MFLAKWHCRWTLKALFVVEVFLTLMSRKQTQPKQQFDVCFYGIVQSFCSSVVRLQALSLDSMAALKGLLPLVTAWQLLVTPSLTYGIGLRLKRELLVVCKNAVHGSGAPLLSATTIIVALVAKSCH